MKRFLSPEQLHKEYGFGLDWQAKRRSSKCPQHERIPFIKLGGFVRYDQEIIELWILQHTIVGLETA